MDQAVNMHFHDIMGKKVCSCSFILPIMKNRGLGDTVEIFRRRCASYSSFSSGLHLPLSHHIEESSQICIHLISAQHIQPIMLNLALEKYSDL